MNDLSEIGFYTLSDDRAKNVSPSSPMQRCELLITSKCNFRCPYCRGTKTDANITFEHAKKVVNLWCDDGLKNIRFSGGEPTIVEWLPDIIAHSKKRGVEHIAISTNGSESLKYYLHLIECGCNDFSISLDACCESFGSMMDGVGGQWDNVVRNIKELSKITYVTTGCVFDEKNIEQSVSTIKFADYLGVSDIRILTAAQYNKTLDFVSMIPEYILRKHKILNYRADNFKNGRDVRGIKKTDNHRCPLVLDDSAVRGNNHYPCIIHMREDGVPIGVVSDGMRSERIEWHKTHNCFEDPICSKNCLDVCVDYNNRVKFYDSKN